MDSLPPREWEDIKAYKSNPDKLDSKKIKKHRTKCFKEALSTKTTEQNYRNSKKGVLIKERSTAFWLRKTHSK